MKATWTIPPYEFDSTELSKHKQWMEDTIKWIIEKTNEQTEANVERVDYNPLYFGDNVNVELKVKKL